MNNAAAHAAPAEKARVFLVNWLFTSLYGMALGEYLALLRKHRFAVDPPYVPRAAFMAFSGLLTSGIRFYEDRRFSPELRNVEVREPLFVLGHWRSGTTLLHNLLALDDRFAHPTVWRVLNPHTFLTTERFSGIVKLASPKTRMIDSMDLGADVPFEDEFAACGSLASPFLAGAFPREAEHYDRYLTFRDVPEEEISRWRDSLTLFYKKMTLKFGRPLVLKSPPHTARVRLLLEMFPDARFVHIHRDPYAVFRSTKGQLLVMEKTTRLQATGSPDPDARIIRRYKTMYDAYFEEKDLIPKGRLHEVRYEDLEKDPVSEMGNLYDNLGLPDFSGARPAVEAYAKANAGYRKNRYTDLPAPLREKISTSWARSFDEWGYARV